MQSPRKLQARRRALKRPLSKIRWQNSPPWWRGPLGGVALTGVLAGSIGAVAAAADAQAPRLAPPGCDVYTVISGDTMSRIARANGITLADLIARNPQITNPDRIWVDDALCIRLTPTPTTSSTTSTTSTTIAPAPVATAPVAEVQRVVKQPDPVVAWPGFNRFIPGEQVVDGVVSQSLVLRALYNVGARGNQLIGLAAVTEGESNRRFDAEGDQGIQDATYGPSIGIFQIRSEKGKEGTEHARDAAALRGSLEHQAWAAVQVYNGALARGVDPLSPWTAHRIGNDRSFVGPYTQLAQALGMLG